MTVISLFLSIFVVLMVMLSIVFAMPSDMETMTPAETSHRLIFGYGGYPRYGHGYGYAGYRGSIGLSIGGPYYNYQADYMNHPSHYFYNY